MLHVRRHGPLLQDVSSEPEPVQVQQRRRQLWWRLWRSRPRRWRGPRRRLGWAWHGAWRRPGQNVLTVKFTSVNVSVHCTLQIQWMAFSFRLLNKDLFYTKGSIGIRNGGGKSWFWTPSWLFLTPSTCGFSVFYVKEASCLISSSSATFTLSSFSSSMTSLISSSTCPILTFYTFLKTSHQMLVNGEEKKSWFDGLHTIFSDFHFVMKVFQRFKTQTESWLPKHIFIPSLNLFTLHHLPAFDLTFPERYKT